jgi:hypothetical protein
MPLLAWIIPVFEIFISGWEKLKDKRVHLAPFIQPGLDLASDYYSRTDLSKAYIIAMCTSLNLFSSLPRTDNISVINPSIRMTWVMNNWEKEWVDNSVNMIKELVSLESTSDSKFEIVYS